MIATVLGPVDKSSVTGSCSAHEHLLQKPSPADIKAIQDNPITLLNLAEARSCGGEGGRFTASNRLFSLDESVQEVRSLVDAGGGLVLECSTPGRGRDPSGLADISTRTGINVVMAASSTGKYVVDNTAQQPAQQPSAEAIGKELEMQLLFGEHVDPIAAVAPSTSVPATPTGRIQAGFLVAAVDESSDMRAAPPAQQAETSGESIRSLEGAVLAQKATGAPLMIVCPHFAAWELVKSAVSVATAHWGDSLAVDKKLILTGMHGGICQSLSCQVAMLEKGLVLCFDCFGRVEWLPGPEYYPSDEESAVRIAELARLGFADRLVISQGVSRRTHLSRFGGHGYSHALRTVPVRLQRLGVSASDISLMMRGNMLQLLDWYTPPPPVEAPKDYLPCSWCGKRFEPVEGEYFHKFQFVYCGIKCLRLHRDTGFDETKLGNTVWPGQTAVDPSSGFSLVHDREGAVNSPACKPKLEGQGQQGFEGPEKTLEIEFDPDVGHENGLRAIRREQWDAILKQAQCHIMHHRGNEWFDSYVLSESSLFVYKSKVVLKTCGTTALLRCLPILTDVTKSYGLSLEWIGYSRKEFQFPTDQIYPHTSFADEVDFLDTVFTGKAYVHGPLNGDRWYTYVADDGKRPTIITADRTLNIMMYGLEPEVAQNFFKSEKVQTADDASLRSGIRRVIPKAILQDHLFDPCGYSMNALEGRGYYTVHVTPESDFSYASFETNVRLPDYDDMVRGVLDVFRPKKFTMTLFADKSGIENIKQNPFDNCDISCGRTSASSQAARYHRTIKTTTNFSGDYLSQMGNWVRAPPEALQPAALQAA